jgi:hypothetical protein
MKVLFLALEFPIWEQASSLPYSCQLGYVEALRAHADVTWIPTPLLPYLDDLLPGHKFDQVWVEPIHQVEHYGFDLARLKEVAPVRIGMLTESLRYNPAHIGGTALDQREGIAEKSLPNLTHILAHDETDVQWSEERGIKSMWLAPAIPTKLFRKLPPIGDKPVFYGRVYGMRTWWQKHLEQYVDFCQFTLPDIATWFDSILEQKDLSDPVDRKRYLQELLKFREDAAITHAVKVARMLAVVNLPAFCGAYPSRVIEAMSCGRPAISCRIEHRPKLAKLFSHEQIFLYDMESSREVTQLVAEKSDARERVAIAGYANARGYHTTETRVEQILRWVGNGTRPSYGSVEG